MSENSDGGGGSQISALDDLLAGGVAGSASVIVGHPFDTIKVRLQTSSANGNSGKTPSSTAGGFKSLFKGMSPPLATAAICNAIIFASYGHSTRLWDEIVEHKSSQQQNEEIHGTMTEGAVLIEHGEHGTHEQTRTWKQQGNNNNNDNEVWIKVKSNQEEAIGTVQAFVICPVEHIKCRLQIQATSGAKQLYKGPIDACVSIIKNHGIFRGLYRGMGVTLWRETPAFGMYFAVYDTIKGRVESLLEEKDDDHPIPSHAHAWAASALAGGISGASTWGIIYPFDVIKSRMQTSPLERHLQKGMWTVGSDIIRNHGVKHMFRGLGVTLVRAFPVNAIIFPVYEFVLMQIGNWRSR
eukprot:scaffold38986_cov153-Skeletonema_marinoi.AAC.3